MKEGMTAQKEMQKAALEKKNPNTTMAQKGGNEETNHCMTFPFLT